MEPTLNACDGRSWLTLGASFATKWWRDVLEKACHPYWSAGEQAVDIVQGVVQYLGMVDILAQTNPARWVCIDRRAASG